MLHNHQTTPQPTHHIPPLLRYLDWNLAISFLLSYNCTRVKADKPTNLCNFSQIIQFYPVVKCSRIQFMNVHNWREIVIILGITVSYVAFSADVTADFSLFVTFVYWISNPGETVVNKMQLYGNLTNPGCNGQNYRRLGRAQNF